ncbi:hypothetical protein J8C02_12040 [Chloracidobacterium sp. MS 40/45]|uniref:hypothetical protein n=1 Tax=Chloracidobacterium aggregatum TaxID=2851959 RepID=UPI001B8BFBDD|nr:hypothetical protein [Chloracidobacterium aggregatum]QUW01615.1 hypothetical protein J8C02_12040 [Chloracidobacterium sp. MS 40/45]
MTVQPVHHPYARHRWPSLAAVLVTLLSFAAFHPPVPAQDRKPAETNLRMTVSETPGRNNGQRTTDLPPTTLSSPVVLWDNGPFNNVNGRASEENTAIPSARSADDFVLTSSATIGTITFDIYASTPTTQPGAVDIYAHSGGIGPVNALPLATYTSTTFTVVGSGFGFDIRRYTVTLSPPLTLAAGRYWVSGYVFGGGSGRGFFANSNGAVPNPEQEGHFRSAFFGYPNWTPQSSDGLPPHFAFTVLGFSKTNVNANVNLVTTLTGLLGSACGPNYLNQFNINANLVNTGAAVLGNPEFQVVELQQANGTPPPNPYRLKTADDYVACNTGGVVGSTQQVSPAPFNLNPGASVPVAFQLDLPGPIQPRRFRFFVDVFAVVGGVSEHVPDGGKGLKRERLGQLAIEVTGFDRSGEPQLATRFVPERKLTRQGIGVGVQGVKGALVRR